MITGQVGVITKNPGWYGRLVQSFTGSPAYHTVTAISETECVSAETPKVLIRPISDFQDVQWTEVDFTPLQRHLVVAFVRRQVGKPYAYLDIILLVIASVLKKRTPMWINDRVMDDRQWFCSELGDAGMEAGGITLFPGRRACMVTPKDFEAVLEQEHAADER